MLLNKIKNDPALQAYIKEQCQDEGICVPIDSKLSQENYVIVKVDEYYNGLGLGFTPASVDCLIFQECLEGEYALTAIELKNIKEARRFSLANIVEKFETCFDDFISVRFKHYFFNNRDYKRIKLYFISKIDVYGSAAVNDSLKIRLLRDARINFKGRRVPIEPRLPSPTIISC